MLACKSIMLSLVVGGCVGVLRGGTADHLAVHKIKGAKLFFFKEYAGFRQAFILILKLKQWTHIIAGEKLGFFTVPDMSATLCLFLSLLEPSEPKVRRYTSVFTTKTIGSHSR